MPRYLRADTAATLKLGPFSDSTDGVTAETALTIAQANVRLSKNGGDFAQKSDTSTATHDEIGYYNVSINATDTDTEGELLVAVSDAAAIPVWQPYTVLPAQVYDAIIAGTDALQVHTNEITSDLITAAVIANGAIDAATFAAGAIDATAIASDAITAAKIANGAIDAATFAAGAIDAAAIATDAIDADAIAADAVSELRGAIFSGTADSGTTTTLVDAALTEADTDYWAGLAIVFKSGSISGQCRLITGFTPATDTLTFAPATTQSVGTNTYDIIPWANVGVRRWAGSSVNPLVSGRVDASVGAMAADTITASAIAADAITSAELAASAVNEIRDAILSDSTPFAGANIDAAISTRATPAQVNTEVLDVLNTDTFAEPGQEAPGATVTLATKIGYLYKFMRNRVTVTSSQISVYNDDATTVAHKSTHSDNGTTYDRGEFATGP